MNATYLLLRAIRVNLVDNYYERNIFIALSYQGIFIWQLLWAQQTITSRYWLSKFVNI